MEARPTIYALRRWYPTDPPPRKVNSVESIPGHDRVGMNVPSALVERLATTGSGRT